MASVLSDIMGKKPAAKKPEEDKKKEQSKAAASEQKDEQKAAAGKSVYREEPAADHRDIPGTNEPEETKNGSDAGNRRDDDEVSDAGNCRDDDEVSDAGNRRDDDEVSDAGDYRDEKEGGPAENPDSSAEKRLSFDFGKLKKAAQEVADIDKVKGFAEKAAGKFAEASDKFLQKTESGPAGRHESVSGSGSASYDKPVKRKVLDRFLDDPLADLPERGVLNDPGEEYGTKKNTEDSDISDIEPETAADADEHSAPPTKPREPVRKKQAIPEAKKAAPGYRPADTPKPEILRADESKPVILLDIILDNTISMSEYYPYIYPKLLRLVDHLTQTVYGNKDPEATDSGKLRFGLSFVRDKNDDLEEYVKTFDGNKFISDSGLFAEALAEVEFYKGAADGREDINGALRLSLEKLWKEAWKIAQQSPEKYSGIENAARCAVLLISDSLPAVDEGEEGAELAPDFAHFIGLEAAKLYVYDNEEYVPGLNCKEYSVSTLEQLLTLPEGKNIMDLKWAR